MNEYQYKEEGYKIIGCCYEVYNTLKAGMLEAIYHQALCVEFDIQEVPSVDIYKVADGTWFYIIVCPVSSEPVVVDITGTIIT